MASKVVFQADTSQFTSPVERSATVVRDLSKALKEQEQAARQTYRDQITNAKAAGASVQELQRIEQERYRSLLALQAAQKQINAENVSNGKASVDSAEAQKTAVDLVTQAYRQQLVAVEATFGAIKQQHAEVTGSIAGGAAIRTIDGGQNIRAVENFLSKTLGLGPALQALFPLVGGVAFVQILVDGAQKLYELTQRANEAGRVLRQAMEDAHAKTQITIDDLAIQADKLQLNIDKLSGHPGNGLQLGLDEAKKSADDLLASLTADRKELEALLKQSHVSAIEGWFSGSSPTGNQEASIKARQEAYSNNIRGIETDINGRYASSTTEDERKSLDAERRRRIEQAMRQELSNVAGERNDLVAGNSQIDVDAKTGQVTVTQTDANAARIGQLDAYGQQIQSQLSLYKYRNKVADLTTQDQNLKGSGPTSKVTDDTRQQWETSLKEQQQYGNLTNAQEREFWLARVQSVETGTDNWRFAYDKYLDTVRKGASDNRKLVDELRKADGELQKQQLKQLQDVFNPGAVAQTRGIIDAQTSGVSLRDAQRSSDYATAESGVTAEQQAGQLSKLDAAVQLQTLHTQQYNEQLKELKDNLAAVRSDDPDATTKRNQINQQIVQLNAGRDQQVFRDNAAVDSGDSSGSVGFRDAIADFVRASRDAASQMRTITENILGGLNQNLSSMIVGGGSNWSGYFRGVGQQVAQTGLQHVEGSLLGGLGLGKPDGSATNPLNVRVIDGSGVPGGLSSLFGGGDDDGKSSGIGGLFGALFGGARANGGSVTAGNAYLVGERGPEPFIPSTSGTVLPTSSLLGGGGDTHQYVFHPNSINSNDPAAVERSVKRAIEAARPGLVADSVSAVNDRRKRLPSNARQ